MMNLNYSGFSNYLEVFDGDMTAKSITAYEPDLSNCTGSTIAELSECLDSYSELEGNINSLFSATSNYLHKAYYNIGACEVDNTVS